MKGNKVLRATQFSQTIVRALVLKGPMSILVASLFFSFMSIGVRRAKPFFSPDTLLFYRALIQTVSMSFWIFTYFDSPSPLLKKVRVHSLRGGVGVVSMFFFYTALHHLPVAATSLLSMTAVFWASLLAWLFLKERLGIGEAFFGLLTFLGFVASLLPNVGTLGWTLDPFGVLMALLCGLFTGIAMTALRSLRKEHGARETVFFFGLCGLIGYFPLFVRAPQFPEDLSQLLMILTVGGCGTAGQLLMTYGFRYASTMVGSLCSFNSTLVNLILGFVLLNEIPPPNFYLGLILVGIGLTGLILKKSRAWGELWA